MIGYDGRAKQAASPSIPRRPVSTRCTPVSSAYRSPLRRAKPVMCRWGIRVPETICSAAPIPARRSSRSPKHSKPSRPLLADASVLKIGHNIKYDALVMKQHGIEIAPFDDTMLLSYVLDGGRNAHGMDTLAERHLGHTCMSFSQAMGHAPGAKNPRRRSQRCRSTRRPNTPPKTPT